jgi:hypothetical protein
MNLNISKLPENTSDLKKLISDLADSHSDLEEKNQFLEECIRLLQNELFGRKSEKQKIPEKDQLQLCLFDEPELLEPEKAATITVRRIPVRKAAESRCQKICHVLI